MQSDVTAVRIVQTNFILIFYERRTKKPNANQKMKKSSTGQNFISGLFFLSKFYFFPEREEESGESLVWGEWVGFWWRREGWRAEGG